MVSMHCGISPNIKQVVKVTEMTVHTGLNIVDGLSEIASLPAARFRGSS